MYIPLEYLITIGCIVGTACYMFWDFGIKHGKTERDIAHFVKTGDWPDY